MKEISLTKAILDSISDVYYSYHRLILLIGSSGTGQSDILAKVSKQTHAPVINVNLQLSRELLELSEHMRVARIEATLRDLIEEVKAEIVVLDRTEMLFDPDLQQDPLRLLQGLSRNHTVISSWHGYIKDGYLYHAEPDHPEFRRYPVKDLTCFTTDKE